MWEEALIRYGERGNTEVKEECEKNSENVFIDINIYLSKIIV